MSVVYLGLQCVSLARKEMDQEFETTVSKAPLISDILQEKDPGFRNSAVDSMESVKICLTQVLQ